MPFETKKSLEYSMDKIQGNKIVSAIASNAFYTSFFIVVIIVMTILFVFRNAEFDEDDSLILLSLRAGIYLLIFVTGAIFLQNRALKTSVICSDEVTVQPQKNEVTGKGESAEKTKNVETPRNKKPPVNQDSEDSEDDNYDHIFKPKGIDKTFINE